MSDVDTVIVELIRALLKHSECIALFILLIFQQIIMHQINVRKLTTLFQQLRTLQAEVEAAEKKHATNGR